MQEVYEFLKKCRTYYLATLDGDQPWVRPFGTEHIFEGRLYIQTGLSKPVGQQMLGEKKVELCAFDGQQWLRVAATAVLDERIEAQESMLEESPHLRRMYTPGDGNTAVFYFEDATATIAGFGGEPETFTF